MVELNLRIQRQIYLMVPQEVAPLSLGACTQAENAPCISAVRGEYHVPTCLPRVQNSSTQTGDETRVHLAVSAGPQL
jgi:hypothetical protein